MNTTDNFFEDAKNKMAELANSIQGQKQKAFAFASLDLKSGETLFSAQGERHTMCVALALFITRYNLLDDILFAIELFKNSDSMQKSTAFKTKE